MNARITQSYWRTAPVYETARTRRTSREHITTAEERTRRSWSQSAEKISNVRVTPEQVIDHPGWHSITVVALLAALSLLIHYGWWIVGVMVGAGALGWGIRGRLGK